MDRVIKCFSIWFPVVILLSIMASCVQAKTFKGKVIDADTKEPIEGAVVVAVWKTERTTPAATHVDLKDVKECLTDKNGKWSISGPKGRDDELLPGLSLFIPYTKRPQFIVFKPGYCSWPSGFYIDACKDKLKPQGTVRICEGATMELPKLTKRDRMTIIQNIPSLGIAGEVEEKLPLFKQLVEEEEKGIRR